jgi:hypothetical protein
MTYYKEQADSAEEITIGLSAAEANCLIEAIRAAVELAKSGQPVHAIGCFEDAAEYQAENLVLASVTEEMLPVLEEAVLNT